MISKTWSRKSLAACLSVAVFSVYSMVALASPGARMPAGELSVFGEVTVNGQKAISGGTLFSESVLVTAEKSNAIVNISKLGRVELSPNSSMSLSFNEKSLTGLLDNGVARVSTLAGISVNLTTKGGAVIVDGSQATTFTVTAKDGNMVVTTEAGLAELRAEGAVKQIAAGESASAGIPQRDDCPRGDCPTYGISGG
ncbi:MAG: hypothetical protein ACRD8U_24335, partial [Pyrinomonadaceae bacterium]